jgi:hypothetical protein
MRNNSRSKSDASLDWRRLDNWRDKLVAAEKSAGLLELYNRFIGLFEHLHGDDLHKAAEVLLTTLAVKGGRTNP